MKLSSRIAAASAIAALSIGAAAPSAFAGHKYNVTTGNGECQQLGGKSAAGTSNNGFERAEENGKPQGGLCPAS